MSCLKASNNKHFNSPAIMSDGRTFTDYRPNYILNNEIIEQNKINNSHNYKVFLTNNTQSLLENNKRNAAIKYQQYGCKKPYSIGTMLPEKTRVTCNRHSCQRVLHNSNGFGEGRSYSEVPNKILDPLTSPEYNFGNNVCADPGDSFSYFPINDKSRNTILRNAVSGGGNMLSGGDEEIIY